MSSLPTTAQHCAKHGLFASTSSVCPLCYRPKGSNEIHHADDHHPSPQVSDTKPQRHKAKALDLAIPGTAEGVRRVVVRFVGRRVRPLDPDNFAGSVKDCLDGLRHCGLIAGDEPWRIILETEQEKVARFAEEETLITITYP